MDFQLLGPVEVYLNGLARPLGGPRQRAVLVSLLIHANEEVRTTQLLELVWSDLPSSARSNLRTYLARLRRILRIPGEPESRLRTRRSGHLVTVRPGELDVATFLELSAKGEQAADPLTACDYFKRALGAWRGQAMENVALGPLLEAEATQLQAQRERVYERYLQTKLTLGQHAEVLPELRAQLLRNPLWERLAGMLIVALYRSGHRTAALNVFRETRERLIEELGLEPGSELRDLQQRLLAGDDPTPVTNGQTIRIVSAERTTTETADITARGAAPPQQQNTSGVKTGAREMRSWHGPENGDPKVLVGRNGHRPAQLPVDLPTFTGRAAELAELIDGERRGNCSISAIDGMAGVGKTALAVHAAHLLAPRFPDGQLYMNLHGHTRGEHPVDPHDALEQILRLFGVRTDEFTTTDVLASVYRSLLSRRKMLVVLDDAYSDSQVSPLLPGTGGSQTLVTSRRRLTGLHQAYPVSVDVLSLAEGVELFASICTPKRLRGQPRRLVEEIVQLCGLLPLAVRIAAMRLHDRPFWTLQDLRDRLQDEQQRLAELCVDGQGVAATFALSLAELNPTEQHTITMLGAYPGSHIELPAAAALAGLDVATAEHVLEQLVDARLLKQTAPTRYQMHALIRDMVIQRIRRECSEQVHTAMRRLMDYHLHTAAAADRLLHCYRDRAAPRAADPVVEPRTFARIDDAVKWCDQLGPDFLDLLRAAARHGLYEHVWQLTVRMAGYFDRRRDWVNGVAAYEIALDAARRLARRSVESELLLDLAFGAVQLQQYDQAIAYYTTAITTCHEIGDDYTEGFSAMGLAKIYHRLRRYGKAVEYQHRALEVYRRIDDVSAACVILDHLGDTYSEVGRLEAATECYREAFLCRKQIDDDYGISRYFVNVGQASCGAGDYGRAISAARQALAVCTPAGGPNAEFSVLAAMDPAAAGEEVRAEVYLTRAERVVTKLRAERADDLDTYLDLLDQPSDS